MVKFHSEEIISQHLGQVILDTSTLMQDRERKVRKSAVKAIDVILNLVSVHSYSCLVFYIVIGLIVSFETLLMLYRLNNMSTITCSRLSLRKLFHSTITLRQIFVVR